ncbi:MAG: PEP-utilizing enzyme [Candidatus Pacearchaeota archaeon]|nr:PEP-utilizing enzyme [Candidatus Pacearchaeota archaeon]
MQEDSFDNVHDIEDEAEEINDLKQEAEKSEQKEQELSDSRKIMWLREISKKDVALVGGKGANLGELFHAEFPVPNAFVITSNAFKEFLYLTNLKPQIISIISSIDLENSIDVEEKSKKIREMIIKSEMPEDLQDSIVLNYEKLSKEDIPEASSNLFRIQEPIFVAVRSSATAEDLADTSFAGQQETFVNMKGNSQVLEAVKKCWASLYTGRSIYYRSKNKIPEDTIFIAIVVQKMMNSEKSGVMFTANPLTNDKQEMVIEAVFGLGDGIVSGSIEPDHFVINKETEEIKEKRIGHKKLAYTRDSRGKTIIQELHEALIEKEVLYIHELKQLIKIGKKIEEHYDFPQDIEFAFESGNLYITQSRPITTLEKSMEKQEFKEGKVLLEGLAASHGIASGKVRLITDLKDLSKLEKGEVLVTKMTNPDMVVGMQRSVAIVTDEGGATCFPGETNLLTSKGILNFEQVYELIENKESLSVLSINPSTLKSEWKKVITAMKRKSKVISISVSQTGGQEDNTLTLTPDHKMLTFDRRGLIKEEISSLIKSEKMVCTIDRIPSLNEASEKEKKLAYLMGAFLTDGYFAHDSRRGRVVFTQKSTEAKKEFIDTVCNYFSETFGSSLKAREKNSISTIRGYTFSSSATDFVCGKKQVAQLFSSLYNGLDEWTLTADREALKMFLAGVADGDGSFNNKNGTRLNIYCADNTLFRGIVLSCLRLGILPQVTMNRGTCYNIQITENLQEVLEYCKRIKPQIRVKKQGTKLFSAKQILSDIIDKVNWKGRIKPYVDNNLLIDSEKIKNRLLVLAGNESEKLSKIISSDLRMKRVIQVGEEKIVEVYNIEVEDNHNYIVFTKLLTPIPVGNCHAAIVSREMGIPCVVGTKKATTVLKEGGRITVDGTSGKVYAGDILQKQPPMQQSTQATQSSPKIMESQTNQADNKPKIDLAGMLFPKSKPLQQRILVKVNCDLPEVAERAAATGADGVGLIRIEFIIAEGGVHPSEYIRTGQADKYTELLAYGIERIAQAFKDKPIWIRTSDIRTDEYKGLKGADQEPKEINPMIGWHGIRRSLDDQEILKAEFKAVKLLHDKGYKNIGVMIPFVIRAEEVKKAKEICRSIGLEPQKDVEFGVMIETPGSCMIIEELCNEGIDFISFGTNDLTQLTLGIDRDNERIAPLFDEMHAGVLRMLEMVITVCKMYGVKTSICGQAGSRPEMAKFLAKKGISSISANIDAVQEIRQAISS